VISPLRAEAAREGKAGSADLLPLFLGSLAEKPPEALGRHDEKRDQHDYQEEDD